MPVYKANGKTYNIPDDKIEAFEKRYPNAEVEIYDNDGAAYSLPLSKRSNFQKKFDKWSYSKPESAAPQETPTDSSETAVDAVPPQPASEEQPWKPTEQEKIQMSHNLDRMMQGVKQSTDAVNEHIENMREYGFGMGQTVEGKMQFNPETGKLEKTYITPAGHRYTSKAIADMESRQYRQAADMSVSSQLRKAYKRLEDLKAKEQNRASEVLDDTSKFNEEKLTPLGRALIGGQMHSAMQIGDKEKGALRVAIRETEELIKNLEEQKDREAGKDVGFWRGFGRTMGDFRTWDFGMSDMMDAMTMVNADQLKGENATEGEKAAYNDMMSAIMEKQQADEQYGGNASFWNRAGVMTGYMPSFMIDFLATGGGFEGINILSKAGAKGAVKVVGKDVVEDIAKQGMKAYVKNNGMKGLGQVAANWTIKALGTTADDLLLRAPLMTNTIQAGKTAADIIDRKLGDVVVDENGNYDFSNDKTWGSAIWQSEANSIVENYSEMFGTHLDPVFTLGNVSKLANTFGAKRLGAVLAKADAGALEGIMAHTHGLFNKMGVSDYVGEVAEEYYGQLWRTMLNLDDAYQMNPDGSRTNLFATGQFHGDIWGGMALSMGLMGAGKHTINAAQYASIKHGVNKADASAREVFGAELWEPLRETIDLTTNDNIGAVAESIVNDKDMTDVEKEAALNYMERSLYMRGFNLGTMVSSRGGEQSEEEQILNESYLDGYNSTGSQEMNDAKNMLAYQRQRMIDVVGTNDEALAPGAIDWLSEAKNAPAGSERQKTILDYLNAQQVYDGMIQHVRDDIDGRIDQSNAMIASRANRTTGMIQGATMKQDDRKVYIISGNLMSYDDGTGIDIQSSDESIIVRDAETGALEQVSPDAVLSIDEAQDPIEMQQLAADAIRLQFAQDAANKIDGVVSFNPGDTYTIADESGNQMQVQIAADENGIVDNGDGTVNATDGTNVFPLSKEVIQQSVDAENFSRIEEFEQQRAADEAERRQAIEKAVMPQYAMNDLVTLRDENGNGVRGNITADADADGRFEVYTEDALNGKRVNLFTADELNSMIMEHNGQIIDQIEQNPAEIEQSQQPQVSALELIPKDEQGNPVYEQAETPDLAWDAIVEQTEGDEAMAQTVADGMVADKEAALKKAEKAKSKGGETIAEKIAAEKERKAAIDAAKAELAVWKNIAQTAMRRKSAEDAEKRRIAEEQAAIRRAEEEKLRAEREEAERIKREALNGVPDISDDTPQDARARGYRRVSGHKVDRQEPVPHLQGNEVSVKFSDDVIMPGRVAVIDAANLQPSHIQGTRNPAHFIDEAQPKERNDEASVLSARKIAGNIRPEEITSSITAYTGAPTVNTRGEAIQGNNRSDALRLMWETEKEQAAIYKQYLMGHASEFGLNADEINAVERPVLVNMLDVEDADAITLGQFVAQDTESGGTERIKPKNAVQKMGADMRTFANILLASSDDETSFAGLVDSNGGEVLSWMNRKGYITPTQFKSAFDSKGAITAEAKNDLKGIMYQSIFTGGNTRLEEMFNAIPAKAQRAILATAFRDYDSPNTERMVEEIQNSIRAYNALSQDESFANAKNWKEARLAVDAWKRQYAMDDVTGESYLPADKFSNFALHLATMYKGESQSLIQGTFNQLYDIIQGTQEENLFEKPDNTPRTLAQAIFETLKFEYDGQQRSNVLAGDSAAGQEREQGSIGASPAGERVEGGEQSIDSTRRTVPTDIGRGRQGDVRHTEGRQQDNLEKESGSGKIRLSDEIDENGRQFVLTSKGELSFGTISGETGLTEAPILLSEGLITNPATNDGYGLVHIEARHGEQIRKAGYKSVLDFIEEVAKNYDVIKVGNVRAGHQTYRLQLTDKHNNTLMIELSGDGTYWNINTAGIFKSSYGANNKEIYNRHTTAKQPTETVGASQTDEQSGTQSASSMNTPISSNASSESKGSEKSRTINDLGEKIAEEEGKVNTNPSDAQKEAGNYKKGHIQVGSFDVTIENPKGSIRSGVDAQGNKWETKMNNTYGYIRGTEGVDGDHIDVFLSDNIDEWNGARVFIIDQYNPDGSFDEHKVMLGFNEQDEAEAAYLSNYDEEWASGRRLDGSTVLMEDFEKWIQSSHRKTKPFAEYKSVKNVETSTVSPNTGAGYSVEPAQYTTKRGKVLDMQLVKFDRELSKDEFRSTNALAKSLKGWFDAKQRGFLMRSEGDAKQLVDAVMDESGETLSDAAPISLQDVRKVNVETLTAELNEKGEAKLSDHSEPVTSKTETKKNEGAFGLVSDDRMAELKERLRKKLGGQLNMGIDPEILAIGMELAVGHIDRGIKTFADFSKKMIEDLGDIIRPYLKAFYNGARDLPEVIENGLSEEMTPYDEVSRFDVANFDKNTTDPFATAEMVVAEQEKLQQTDEAKKDIVNKRNTERRKDNEQKEADTEVIVSEAEAVAGKAESDIENASDERQLNEIAATLDEQIDKVNNQLALLGYYEVEEVEKDFNEMYGYMRNAEKKAVKDANNLAKKLVEDLGIDPATIVDRKGKKRKSLAEANIAPAGGDVSFRLPLTPTAELYFTIQLNPTPYKLPNGHYMNTDNLSVEDIMYRIEDPTASGVYRYGNNKWAEPNVKYGDLIKEIKSEIKRYVPEFSLPAAQEEKSAAEQMKELERQLENGENPFTVTPEVEKELAEQREAAAGNISNTPFKVGDKVMYKGEEATVYAIEDNKPVLDTGLAPVMYEVAQWSDLSPISQTIENKSSKKSTKKKKSVSSHTELADLFSGLFDDESLNSKNNDNGLQGNDAVRSEGLSADSDRDSGTGSGESDSREIREENRRRTDGSRTAGSERIGDGIPHSGIRPSGRLQGLTEEIAPSERKNTHNNHSEIGANHAPTSVDARIEANIKAIELAQQLINSGEQATEKQMQVLRKFSGWGGLGKAFSDNLYSAQLQQILGSEAYQDAVMSANSAYYTPAYVVDTLWDIAEQMGFKGGKILEGSAGIGNILGQMPTNISERSDIHAIEIDGTSGGILSLLYPDAKVDIQGFEQTRIPNGSVDLAITNVPFVTGLRVNDTSGDKDLSKKFHNIHDFCIAKNVRKLREGGLGIFITSNGTLDNSKQLRDWIVSEGGSDFIGAFRMNNKTFGGTGVTSDIIVIRKRVNGRKSANAIDVSTITGERSVDFNTGETRKVKGQAVPVMKHLAMDYNRYFVEHPENMAGVMQFAFEQGDTFRPTSKGLYPAKGMNQESMLADFVRSFKKETDTPTTSVESDKAGKEYVSDASADGKKLGELYIKDGKLVVAELGGYSPLAVNSNKVKGHTKEDCFKAYKSIKDALAEVLKYQSENESDEGLKPLLSKLNKAYDSFVSTYGHFNKNTAIAFLRNDVDFANVISLEKYEETGDKSGNRVQKFGKADVFSQRVVEKEKEPTPTNVKDGIIASVFKFGRIDVPYIAEHLGKSVDEVKKEIITSGYGFEDPATRQIEISYQYLSGNVREKLRQAQENNENGEYDGNIKALQKVIPMDIPAHLIDFTLGSSWITPKLYEDYIKERTDLDVKLTSAGGTWFMDSPYYVNNEKNRSMGVYSEMLHKTVFGHSLIEAAIQNKTITVSQTSKKWDGSTETITDKDATQACAAKIDEIRQDFKDWARQKMQSDSEMSADMERLYNDTFNNYVPADIPKEFAPARFEGQALIVNGKKFSMFPHQSKAVVRGTMQPLLLAHEVGTGKTFTLISTAMEMRRLGTARKPMIVVQNATVGQFVASAKELYPNVKILTLEEADRTAEGRKNFYAKIRHNDWDMIVVPQSTFEFIPDSEERQMQFVQDKIEEKMAVLEKMKDADPREESMITRQAKKEISDLEAQLAELTETASKKRSASEEKKRAVTLQNTEVKALEMLDRRTDDVENFDDMGIDALLIDEAHEYKHLGFATAMQRGVKGVDSSYSKKSQGVYLKTQAVLEKNNGRNVIFATGTPISNTAAEIWTFMRYLMPADTMKEYGIYYFDDFVRNFGNIQQMLEFTTSGKYKENNRFAGYVNLPELVRIWSGVSDTVLTKEAGGVNDKIPEMEGGKAQDLYLPQTKALRSIMKYVKSELQRYEEMSGKDKKANSHIPLTMYGIAKSAAVDARLVSDAEDDPNSKTNEAVRQTLRSLRETASYKGTVAIFSDNYQNKETGFNLYDDIREKLIAQGVPAEEVAIIRPGMTVKKKLEIFEKVNRGEIRVILGSTYTLGTGVNIQERLHTLIHLDAPNRPMDYTQRNGRILRQGNLHKEMGKPVRILRFGVEDSLDVTAYQRLKTKGAIADSIMNGKQMMANSMTNRVLEEEEDVFGDTVAQLSGSEYAMLKNNAEKNVRKYESRKKQWEADQTYIHNAKPKFKAQIAEAEKRAKTNKGFLKAVEQAFPGSKFDSITAGKQTFPNVEAMADFVKEHNKKILDKMKQMKEGGDDTHTRELTVTIGDYSFKVRTVLTKDTGRNGGQLFSEVNRKMTYSCPELGLEDVPVSQNLLKNAISDIVENVLTGKNYAERAEAAENEVKHLQSELKQIESREGVPFEYAADLEQAKKQYAEYAELMKKEMEEKEAKYAEMDKNVEAASDIATSEDEDDDLMRDSDTMYRIRESAAPKKTGIGYKVFVLKNGKLYPPMVANPNGEATPVGVWLDADAAPIAGQSKTGRNQVKAGGKGTQGGSGKLAYRPGWHLGEIPYALQFNRVNPETGEKELFPANFVWAEVEYANDVDYQEEAMSYGMNSNGKFQHSLAGLPRIPENGSYRYRTNPNPETDPWVITGAMRVNRLLTPSEVDAMVEDAGREPQQRQDGAVTDAQINALNAEIESSRNVSPRKIRKQMSERVKELTDALHLDNVDVVTSVDGLKDRQKKAKGFYTKSTGRITIVIPNNTSLEDVEQTLLHEAVAHYGLRKMFGSHFDTFLDNVFNNADEEIRRKIVDLSAKNGWDFRKATEEYLAGLAERTNFEEARKSGWWQKVKKFFSDMLDKLGFANFRGVTLTDNELRYVLWRSYENLKDGNNIFGEAADVAMQYELGVGEYANTSTDDVLNRDGDPEMHERALARHKYEMRVKSGMYQSREALQDSMLGLEEGMRAIVGGKNFRVEEIDDFENAYTGENALSSVSGAEAEAFDRTLFKPMLAEVAKLAPTEADREELTDYMMAKHGLERNAYMRANDTENEKADETDYAGLTALTGLDDVADAEAEAQSMVDEYEDKHKTEELWKKVNAVSDAILSKSYECGMMSKETYDKVSNMYEFYIPLRGFDEKTSAEAYAYLTHSQSAFNAPIKKAEGRRSKADDPFANLQSMAESAITQGNRNKLVKQKFLNFALNHPSDLVSVNDLWLQYDAVKKEWVPVFPGDIDINDSPEEVERKMNDFEEKMKQLAESDPKNFKRGKDAANIPYRVVESRDLRQHQVVVRRNGRDYVLTVNGNPRLAQALNGQTNPDNETSGSVGQILHVVGDVNRTLSSLYTTLQPDFVASNFLRDTVYSNSMVWVKESPKYALQYNKNFAKLPISRMKSLLAKYRNGNLDMNDSTEKMFYQFIMNGGETGFARMADIDEHKKLIKKTLKTMNEKIPLRTIREYLTTWIGEVGRGIEMRARFAAFVTSRNSGRSVGRSIWDAKEISVNFNKKGAGDKFLGKDGQTIIGNTAAFVSGAGRISIIFWNAALQGTFGNFGKYALRNPVKASALAASWFGLALLVNALASSGGDDDDDSYYDIPEHTRRQNFIVKGPGNTWIKVPLPIEFRAIYGMGELAGSTIFHNEELDAHDVLTQLSQLLPVDLMEGGKGLIPSSIKPITEVANNESWYGSPIWKDTPYNKYHPQWTKAYKNANKDIVNFAAVLNELSGGNKYRKGAIDINPAAVEYLLKQYTGGFFTLTNQLRNLADVAIGEKEFDWRYVPLANRMLMSGGDERNANRGLDEKFFNYLDSYRAKASEFSAIKGDNSLPLEKKAELINEIITDEDFILMKRTERVYSKLNRALKDAKEMGNTEIADELEKKINELKRNFISEIEDDKRK